MRRALSIGLVLATVVVWGGVGSAQRAPEEVSAASARPPGEQYFHVEWHEERGSRGTPVIAGHVYNDGDSPAMRVRLTLAEIDAGGREVWRTMHAVTGTVPPHGRVYFEAPVRRPGAGHKVTVDSFEMVEGVPGS